MLYLRRRVVPACGMSCALHCTELRCAALQPENLLYESTAPDAPIKLADFGLAKIVGPGGGQLMHTTCGTPG
jgi:serine/threonine protein kinase